MLVLIVCIRWVEITEDSAGVQPVTDFTEINAVVATFFFCALRAAAVSLLGVTVVTFFLTAVLLRRIYDAVTAAGRYGA